MTLSLPLSVFVATCFVASYTDVRWRRVPNALTFGSLFVVTLLNFSHGPLAMIEALGSATVVVVVGSFIFGLGWLGGGDIKLLATGAAAVGFPQFFFVLLYVAALGGLIGAIYAVRENRLRTIVTNVALSALAGTNVTPAAASRRIPYALAICAGACCYAASESFAPWFRLVH